MGKVEFNAEEFNAEFIGTNTAEVASDAAAPRTTAPKVIS